MKKLFVVSTVLFVSQVAFSAPYVCSMVSKVDGKVADLFAVKVELTSDMATMADIAPKDSVPIYARAAVKQAGDDLYIEIDEKPTNVMVVKGKAGSELSYFFSNGADRSVTVECKPL